MPFSIQPEPGSSGATPTTPGTIELAGDLAGTGSVSTAPRVGNITGSGGVATVTSEGFAFTAAGAPSATGLLRLPNNTTIKMRNGADDGDRLLLTMDAFDNVTIGDVDNASVALKSSTSIRTQIGVVEQMVLTATAMTLSVNGVTFDASMNAPKVSQTTSTTAATGAPLTLQAQDSSFAGSEGGSLNLTAGVGDNTNGAINFRTGGFVNFTMTDAVSLFQNNVAHSVIGFSVGASVGAAANTGNFRAPNATTIVTARNALGTNNLGVLATNASNEVLLGAFTDGTATGTAGVTIKSASGTIKLSPGGVDTISTTSTSITMAFPVTNTSSSYTFGAAVVAPTISQATHGSGSGEPLTLQAQNAFTGSFTGGQLTLKSGTGTTAAGNVVIATGATTQLTISPTLATFVGSIVLPGSNPASTGNVRAANNTTIIAARNAANGADLLVLSTDGTDSIFFGGPTNTVNSTMRAATSVLLTIGATPQLTITSTLATFAGSIVLPGTNPATTGNIRSANNTTIIAARNAGNTANAPILKLDTSDGIVIGDATVTQYFQLLSVGVASLLGGGLNIRNAAGDTPLQFVPTASNNVATTGLMRVANAQTIIASRNAANSANFNVLVTDSANAVAFSCGVGGQLYFQVNAVSQAVLSTSALTFTPNAFSWVAAATAPVINQTQATAGNGVDMTVTAQAGFGTGATNGGALILRGGARNSTGNAGGVKIGINGSSTSLMFETTDLGNLVRRVTALNLFAAVASANVPTGDLVTLVGNAAVVPSSNPTAGLVMYADTGRFAVYGPATTTTKATVGAAGAAAAQPATPQAYWQVMLDGTLYAIPCHLP